MFLVIFILIFIIVGLGLIALRANFSIAYAIRYKEPLHRSARYIKLVLIGALIIYGLVLGMFLAKNTGSKRSITIESKTLHGVIVINQIKYPIYFKTNQVSLIYHVNNPIDYLFLNNDVLQVCYVSALLRLAIVILAIIFLWRFDFDQPFQWEYYNAARVMWGLILITAVLEIITNLYSGTWVRDTFNTSNNGGPQYQYIGNNSEMLMVSVVIISSLFYMYGQAIRNREEIDLTI